MLNENTKKNIRDALMNSLKDIADKDYQKRSWIDGKEPGYGYDDLVCDFFDLCDDVLDCYKDFNLSKNQHLILKEFRDEFRTFSDNNVSMPAFWIDSPEWLQITQQAKDVLAVFSQRR